MQNRHFRGWSGFHPRLLGNVRLSCWSVLRCQKNQEWNEIQIDAISPQTGVFWQTRIRPKPSSITLHRLAFHKLEHPFIILAITCEARLHCQQRGSRLYQDPSYLWAFFPPLKTESNVTMLSFMCARVCVGAAVVFISISVAHKVERRGRGAGWREWGRREREREWKTSFFAALKGIQNVTCRSDCCL